MDARRDRRHHLALTLIALCLVATGCQRPTQEPDEKNELPFGFVDAPTPGATVDRQIPIYGWALDDQGVREVRIFVDGKYIARARLTQPRPDVTQAYPAYARGGDMHGWNLTIMLGDSFTPGTHTILAQAVDTQGATRDLGAIPVSVAF